jgi:hypothetical protein
VHRLADDRAQALLHEGDFTSVTVSVLHPPSRALREWMTDTPERAQRRAATTPRRPWPRSTG